MPLNLGSASIGSLYLGSTKIAEAWRGNVKVYGSGLPPYTIRLKFQAGTTPSPRAGTVTLVSSEPNIWDYTYQNQYWDDIFRADDYYTGLDGLKITEVIDANLTGVLRLPNAFLNATNLSSVAKISAPVCTTFTNMFSGCTNLVTVVEMVTDAAQYMGGMFHNAMKLQFGPLLSDTSNVLDMGSMFYSCLSLVEVPMGPDLYDTAKVWNFSNMFYNDSRLQYVPLFDTSNATGFQYLMMGGMFYGCNNVEGGALALYQQASTQSSHVTNHDNTFYNCGQGTQTGVVELEQIPASWGGRAS